MLVQVGNFGRMGSLARLRAPMRRRAMHAGLWFSMAAALLASAPRIARAGDPSGNNVTLEVVLVYGSAQKGKIDPGLISIKDLLQKRLPMNFGTLQKFESKRIDVPFGEIAGMRLPTGASVRFLPLSIIDGRLHMHFEMPGASMRLQVRSGRPVIVGGQPYNDGIFFVELTPSFGPIVADDVKPTERIPTIMRAPERSAPRQAEPRVERVGTTR